MKIYFLNQEKHFNAHLSLLRGIPIMEYDKETLVEKCTEITSALKIPFQDLDLDFLFDYQIFPSNIMTSLAEWKKGGRKMCVGDTIVQQIFIPPFRLFSLKMISGVRIAEIIDLPDKKGFSYETLEGHVEKGISTFTVESRNNQVVFKIHTFSRPGNFLTRIAAPLSVPYQAFCTKSALHHLKEQLELRKEKTD